jgi:hypothetical protein
MKRSTLIITGSLVAVGLLAFFLVRAAKRRKSTPVVPEPKPKRRGSVIVDQLDTISQEEYDKLTSKPSVPISATSGGQAFNMASNILGTLTNYADYEVATQTMPLNVRENPDSKAKIVASLPKGSTIKGKASGVKGWFEVSKDGINPIGYVSAQYLKFKKA